MDPEVPKRRVSRRSRESRRNLGAGASLRLRPDLLPLVLSECERGLLPRMPCVVRELLLAVGSVPAICGVLSASTIWSREPGTPSPNSSIRLCTHCRCGSVSPVLLGDSSRSSIEEPAPALLLHRCQRRRFATTALLTALDLCPSRADLMGLWGAALFGQRRMAGTASPSARCHARSRSEGARQGRPRALEDRPHHAASHGPPHVLVACRRLAPPGARRLAVAHGGRWVSS